jgi:hypothetical protein
MNPVPSFASTSPSFSSNAVNDRSLLCKLLDVVFTTQERAVY